MELIVAILAIGTSALNVVLLYIEPEPAYWSKLFTSFDSAACVTFLIVYILKMYVATHRMQYIFSVLSLLDLFTLLPTIVLFQVSYDNSFYFMIPFSRYARSVTSFLIIQRYFKLGQSDVDRQINIVFITMLLLTYIASGMYAIVENQKRKLSDKTFLQFHDSVYFVIVSLATVGYGDEIP
jgi:hypothetical protein